MTVTVLLEMQAKPESTDALISKLREILPDTRAYDGCKGVDVTQNQDDSANILLIEAWETRAKYETYLNWRVETGVVAALGEMVAKAPSIRYFDGVDA